MSTADAAREAIPGEGTKSPSPHRSPSADSAAVGAPTLSVVIPAYREERRLPASLERLPRELSAARFSSFEVIVVDDGSDDRTSEVVRAAAARDQRIRLVRHETNHGKGFAVRAGVAAARGAWILSTDADCSTPPALARRLFDAAGRAGRDGAAVVIGSRRTRGARIVVRQPIHREVIGFVFAALRRLLVLPTLRDTQCGFKLFRGDAARSLFFSAREDGFIYDVEILAEARRRRLRIVEVPVDWSDDARSQVVATRASVEMGLGLLRLAWRRLLRAGLPPLRRR